MANISNKTTLRNKYVEIIKNALIANGEEVDMVASNKFNFPCVDEENNEEWVMVTVTIPLGEGRGKEPYDGYGERTSYQMKVAEKAEKAKAAEEKKAKKIELDKKKRAAQEARKHEEEGE